MWIRKNCKFMSVNNDGSYGEITDAEVIDLSKCESFESRLISTGNEVFTMEFTGAISHVDGEMVLDLFAPVKCNCRNCGAPVRFTYCEYCGTQYPNDMKLRFSNK